ncbi:TolC family protein [Pantoea agglomerans]|uniref:TolC family protein n=1 Tax=Enterobacter agglomerans TaxID=549 RepID=A0A7X2MI56_ENTAG|nr:TolC family protein [Pantoea agglomerans]
MRKALLAYLAFGFISFPLIVSAGEPLHTDAMHGDLIHADNKQVMLSLSEAISLGLRNNPAIRSAYLHRISQKFDLRVAEDSFTPKLVISGNYLRGENQENIYSQNTLSPTTTLLTPYGTRLSLGWAHNSVHNDSSETYSNDGADFTVIQPLLRNAGKEITTANRELARLSEAQHLLEQKNTVSHTVTEIAEAYRALQKAAEEAVILQSSLQRAKDLVMVNSALIKAGRMARLDIVQTEAEVAGQQLSLEQAQNAVESARLQLLQLLAIDLSTPLVIEPVSTPVYTDINSDRAIRIARNVQPAFLSRLLENKKDDINVLLTRNGQLWDVSLIAGSSDRQSRGSGSGSDHSRNNYVGIQVDIPVGDLSSRQAALSAEVSRKAGRLEADDMEQKLRRDILIATNDITTRWKQFVISQRAAELTQQKVDIERQKLAAGRSTNFQVVSFDADLRNAESARLAAAISYQNSLTELDEIMGTTLQSWGIMLNDQGNYAGQE